VSAVVTAAAVSTDVLNNSGVHADVGASATCTFEEARMQAAYVLLISQQAR
jgi:hypothetical protein